LEVCRHGEHYLEAFSLMGESRCGKMATSRLILRLDTPTSGEMELDRKHVPALSGACRLFMTSEGLNCGLSIESTSVHCQPR
jgi:ABC-type oligopeptide transport system ATPase subunit